MSSIEYATAFQLCQDPEAVYLAEKEAGPTDQIGTDEGTTDNTGQNLVLKPNENVQIVKKTTADVTTFDSTRPDVEQSFGEWMGEQGWVVIIILFVVVAAFTTVVCCITKGYCANPPPIREQVETKELVAPVKKPSEA